ncbi:MFS transporter [uncultured Sanguibacteroides sp.]|uniref:MFS transporter n=1 Tax=uncultured Sanguibacteroides sp. TaxID=1635151 RepID=UPI0025D1AB94|nr:MFS transporter [uncultured Sanguibacteroides sp.]
MTENTTSDKMVNMDTMPLRWGHIRILIIASAGQFFGGVLAILIGVIAPLIAITHHPELSSWAQGFVFSSGLIGITIGSLFFGHLSDKYGYLFFFRLCPLLILFASLWIFFSQSILVLTINLLIIGFSIGGGYALDPSYVSEIMPKKWKKQMLGISKASSALGNVLMIIVAYYLLKSTGNPEIWNKLFLFISIFAAAAFLSRIHFAESPEWLAIHGKVQEAEKNVRYFLGNDVYIGELANKSKTRSQPQSSWKELFVRGNIKKIILSGIPWGCEGMGVYGIGIFTPILLLSLGFIPPDALPFDRVIDALRITLYINLAVISGFILGISLINKINPIRDQSLGFFISAIGLFVVLLGYMYHLPAWVILIGFMLFEVALNAGPHMMTFILPSRIYDLQTRASGEGIASALGKLGAIIATFIIPPLLKLGGGKLVLLVAIGILILGGVITAIVGPMVFKRLPK